jgi:hypothetical protein
MSSVNQLVDNRYGCRFSGESAHTLENVDTSEIHVIGVELTTR